jgi:hypothetical protein
VRLGVEVRSSTTSGTFSPTASRPARRRSLLIRADGQVARADGAWTDWLVVEIVDFVVWGERPTGSVERDAAQWLTKLPAANGTRTKIARRIARELRHEAELVEEPMVSFEADEEVSLRQEIDGATSPLQLAA